MPQAAKLKPTNKHAPTRIRERLLVILPLRSSLTFHPDTSLLLALRPKVDAQRRPVEQLHRHVERVHVHMRVLLHGVLVTYCFDKLLYNGVKAVGRRGSNPIGKCQRIISHILSSHIEPDRKNDFLAADLFRNKAI